VSSSKRWVDSDSDADDAERSILRAGLGSDPPPQLEDELFRRVLAAAALPAAVEPGGAGPSVDLVAPGPAEAVGSAAAAGMTAKAVSTLTLLGKGFVAGIGVSVAVAAGQHWAMREPVRADATQRAPATKPPSVPSAPEVVAPAPVVAQPAPSTGASNVPIKTPETSVIARRPLRSSDESARMDALLVPEQTGASRPRSQLEEEAALLKAARQQLRQGALAAAFATLETSRQRFSASALEQEREALMIELLYRSGQRAAAAARARAFLQQHAESPHRGQLQKFAE
jgi:hypothetical protein